MVKKKNIKKIEVLYEIVDFFVLDMCSKPIFCSKVAQNGKICSRLLESQKVTQKLPSTVGRGLPLDVITSGKQKAEKKGVENEYILVQTRNVD